MKEFLTIGQFAVTGSSFLGAGGKREIEPHARLEMMHELLARSTSRPTAATGKSEFFSFLIVPHHSSQRQETKVSRALRCNRREGETEGRVFQLLEGERQFRSQEQYWWISVSPPSCSPQEGRVAVGKTSLPAQLLRDCSSVSQLQWDPKSISDWADKWGAVLTTLIISHPDEDHWPSKVVSNRMIASFVGRAASVFGDTAYVTVFNDSTGERFEAECEASFLRQKGIEEGMEFLCTVTRRGDQTIVEFAPLPPKVLSEEELEEISKEVDSRLK